LAAEKTSARQRQTTDVPVRFEITYKGQKYCGEYFTIKNPRRRARGIPPRSLVVNSKYGTYYGSPEAEETPEDAARDMLEVMVKDWLKHPGQRGSVIFGERA
jgi:hypothetical protein